MKKLLPWLTALAILVVIFGTIYGVVQQAQRRDANYPQIQLAEDTANALNAGAKPHALVTGRVSMAKSLAPFRIIYDKNGKVVTGSGYLNGHVAQVPLGVLTAANGKDYSWVTWQPAANVREAVVTVAANKYYVLSGRSLTEVEKNENHTFMMTFVGGVLTALVLAAAYLLNRRLS